MYINIDIILASFKDCGVSIFQCVSGRVLLFYGFNYTQTKLIPYSQPERIGFRRGMSISNDSCKKSNCVGRSFSVCVRNKLSYFDGFQTKHWDVFSACRLTSHLVDVDLEPLRYDHD